MQLSLKQLAAKGPGDTYDETVPFFSDNTGMQLGEYFIKFNGSCEEKLTRPLIVVNGFDPAGEGALRLERLTNEFDGYSFGSAHRIEPPLGGFKGEGENGEMILYPNPAIGQVTIAYLPEDQSFNLTIFSATGQIIQRLNNLNSPVQTLDVSELIPGFYMLQLSTADGETQQLRFSVAR